MPPFENAPPYYMRRTLRTWYSQVKPDLRDPELLWGDCWKRFNTVRIPVLPDDKHFERALEIARIAKDRQDFERIFRERNSRDWKELLDLLDDILMHASYHSDGYPCKDARNKVFKASQTGTLLDLISVLKGLAFGWEADEICERPDDNFASGALSADEGEAFPELDDIDFEEERALDGGLRGNVIFHGTYTYFSAPESASRQASEGAQCSGGDELLTQQKPALSSTMLGQEHGRLKEAHSLQRKRKRPRLSDDGKHDSEIDQASSLRSADEGSIIGAKSPPSDGNDRSSKRRKVDDSITLSHTTNPCSQPSTSPPRKRPTNDDSDGGQRHKRQKLDFSERTPEADTIEPRVSKTPVHDDDDTRAHKHRKPDTPSQRPPAAFESNASRTDKPISQKRSISDNDDDDDDDDDDDGDDGNRHRHRQKRQRLDSSIQQRAGPNTKESRPDTKQRSRRSRRKGNNVNRAPEHVKTRSLNRIRPSTFWELDQTGKASIRI